MYVTVLELPELAGEEGPRALEWLNESVDATRYQGSDGLVQAYLLRGETGGVLSLAFWRSRSDFQRFLASGAGSACLGSGARLVGKKGALLKSYFTTWQAVYTETCSDQSLGSTGCGGCHEAS